MNIITKRQRVFEKNYNWQKKFLDQIVGIIKQNASSFISVRRATITEDTKQSTDMVLELDVGGDIGVRIRRGNCNYRDFTIRTYVGNGIETEVHKIQKGWCDWYVYAWSNTEDVLDEWVIVNIKQARQQGIFDRTWAPKYNTDGTRFIAISIEELEKVGAIVNKRIL